MKFGISPTMRTPAPKPRRSTASRLASPSSAPPCWPRRPEPCARAPPGRPWRRCCRRPSPWCGRHPKGPGMDWDWTDLGKMVRNEGKKQGWRRVDLEILRLNNIFAVMYNNRLFKYYFIKHESLVDQCVLLFISVYNFIHYSYLHVLFDCR